MMLRVGLGDFELTEQEFRRIFPAMQRFIARLANPATCHDPRQGDSRKETLAARQELLGSLKAALSEKRFEIDGRHAWNLNAE